MPWHRAYVEMYENAARVLTNNPKFAMPYWNWTSLRQLPSAFTDKTYKGQPNPLFVPGRGDPASMVRNSLTGQNALTDALVGPKVIASIFKETVYEAFGTSRPVDYSVSPPQVQNNLDPKWVPMGGGDQGILERTPHNNVHNNIGAYMPQSNSPRDPIFMMHHGNIDRIWAHWTALGRRTQMIPCGGTCRSPTTISGPTARPTRRSSGICRTSKRSAIPTTTCRNQITCR